MGAVDAGDRPRLRGDSCRGALVGGRCVVPGARHGVHLSRDLHRDARATSPAYQVIWLAALFGAIVARADGAQWAFPALWKLPLAYWALIVALVWPIVVARETDFRWSTMAEPHVSNSGLGGPPAAVVLLVLNVALTHLLGLLSFDSFFRTFGTTDGGRFKRVVIAPLGVSLLLGAGLALYQGLVDISWLSGHQWPSLQRAAGGLLDGDGFGTLAGFWSGTALTLANSSVAGLLTGSAGTGHCVGWAVGDGFKNGARGWRHQPGVYRGLRASSQARPENFLLLLFLACTVRCVDRTRKGSVVDRQPFEQNVGIAAPLSRTSLLKFAKTELFDRSAAVRIGFDRDAQAVSDHRCRRRRLLRVVS